MLIKRYRKFILIHLFNIWVHIYILFLIWFIENVNNINVFTNGNSFLIFFFFFSSKGPSSFKSFWHILCSLKNSQFTFSGYIFMYLCLLLLYMKIWNIQQKAHVRNTYIHVRKPFWKVSFSLVQAQFSSIHWWGAYFCVWYNHHHVFVYSLYQFTSA